MKCPVDAIDLTIAYRHGLAIRRCPVCQGVWLGRSEVEKLIERAQAEVKPSPAARPPRFTHDDDRPVHRRHRSLVADILDTD